MSWTHEMLLLLILLAMLSVVLWLLHRKRQTKLMFGCDGRKGPEWTALTSGMGHFQCPDESR
jgi:hypothetical protein